MEYAKFFFKKTKFFLCTLIAFAGIVGVLVLPGAHYATGSALPSMYSHSVENARAQLYRPIIGSLSVNEVPWIFDGKYVGRGIVLEAWDGGTEHNLKACKELWSDQPPYSGMCKKIKDLEIIAVKMADMETNDVVFVPVERIAKLRKRDEIVIHLGEITVQGAVKKLPSLLNVTKWNSSP